MLSKLYLLFDKLLLFLISTSLFLAISGSFKVIFSGLLSKTFIIDTAILTFLVIFSTYGLNKLTDLKEDTVNNPERVGTIKKLGHIFKFSVALSFILALILGFLVNILILPVLLFPLFSGILYSIRLSKNLPRLKDITGVKNIIIALTWAVSSTLLPIIYSSGRIDIYTLLIFYFFFFKSYINSILFDACDIEGDSMHGMRTIPILLGKSKTKKLLLILNSTFIPWLILSYYVGIFHRYVFILAFSITYGYWYILHFYKEGIKRSRSLDLLVDGEWIPIIILVLIFV
ncbi:UbiA family prenyltransferase [Candidatus Methanoperedens nitratireducens]|uniref:UbiA family prenyltransferase n=1 Tax=Candidatus Methanoperedens nitratireducens TaxID=1392998 RepID=UPI00373AEA60